MISPPGKVAPPSEDWSKTVSKAIKEAVEAAVDGSDVGDRLPPFYNPLEENLEAAPVTVKWSALSGTLGGLSGLSDEERWALADATRIAPKEGVFGQDEYCEWSVTRNNAGEITRVTFTSEVGEWYEHLAMHDRPGLIALYKELTGADVKEEELFPNGSYDWRNPWNQRTDGPIVHLAQKNNNLGAAISLAAEAAVVRVSSSGEIITDSRVLMECNGLGNADRFSDPSIATTINGAAAAGARISLADPPGLYLAGIRTEGMRLPPGHDGLEPSDLWKPKRGEEGRVVRATFEPPDDSFTLSKVFVDGKPIISGAQLANKVDVAIVALVNQANVTPVTKPCG